jgi:hypothetical protein
MENLLWKYELAEIKTDQFFTQGDEIHAHKMNGQNQEDLEQLQKFRDIKRQLLDTRPLANELLCA